MTAYARSPAFGTLAAEAFGTFGLVFSSCGAIVVNDLYAGHVGVCMVFGLIVMAMIHTFGNVSGTSAAP